MKTLVKFVPSRRKGKNSICAHTLRKVSFIDNQLVKNSQLPSKPRAGEYWVVEIVRENMRETGGCFILKPLEKVEEKDLVPLVHGMYDLRRDGDAVIIEPREPEKLWAMSPAAKRSIQQSYPDAKSVIISYGGDMWQRRQPPESVVEAAAKELLSLVEDDDE